MSDRGVEIKLADRVRALETLWNLLACGDGGDGAEALFQALEAAAETLEDGDGE